MRLGALVLTVTAVIAGGVAPASAGAATAPTLPHQYLSSSGDFYRAPNPLPPAPRGTLIRTQVVRAQGGATTARVMYHSSDAQDRDRAVTGIVTFPTSAPPPAAGWPVTSWAHPTAGLASQCAPSRTGLPAPWFGPAGVRVATDYIGLGPVGERHSYLQGTDEARSVIDIVRAVRQIPAAHAGTRWVAIGQSQGGHAALFTNQLAQAYAPELQLRGVVAIAPYSGLDRYFGGPAQFVPRLIDVLSLYGLAMEYPQVDPDQYLGAAVTGRQGVLARGCIDDIANALMPIPIGAFYKTSPLFQEPFRDVLALNDPGHVRSNTPLLVISGTADTFVIPQRVTALLGTLCSVGQVTGSTRIIGGTHASVTLLGWRTAARWLNDRLANRPAPNACRGR
jgi:fermentation-respiration switch protein FrsA (DUF1100 family)